MSRGLGVVERSILECIDGIRKCEIRELPYLQPALSRAMRSLRRKGIIQTIRETKKGKRIYNGNRSTRRGIKEETQA
jgi:predicted transcriptional regulator